MRENLLSCGSEYILFIDGREIEFLMIIHRRLSGISSIRTTIEIRRIFT